MIVNEINENGRTTLVLEGRLNISTAPELTDRINGLGDEVKALVLDFTAVDYVASAGLRSLVAAQKKMKMSGGTLTLTGITPDVMDVLEMTGLTKVFDIQK